MSVEVHIQMYMYMFENVWVCNSVCVCVVVLSMPTWMNYSHVHITGRQLYGHLNSKQQIVPFITSHYSEQLLWLANDSVLIVQLHGYYSPDDNHLALISDAPDAHWQYGGEQ